MAEPVEMKLQKPIQAHGVEISTLTFRRPSGGDIVRAGNPVIIDPDTGKIAFDDAKMGAMIARLANIPPSSVDGLDGPDFINACWSIAGFFMPSLGSTSTSTSPSGSA